jgi:hypothetical protein
MSALDLSEYVRVTNRTGAAIKSRYDGRDYLFSTNEPTDIHQLAAAHIFGFGQKDKTNAFHRLGLLNHMTVEMANEWMNDIEFGDVPSPAVDIGPRKKIAKATKTGSPTPLADAGADDGEGDEPSPAEASGKGAREAF